jgi:signal transduction histidine kinase
VGELATGIAHEINNPINGIINCAQILADEIKTTPENHQFITTILSEGARVANIVRRLVRFSRSEIGEEELTESDLRALIENVLSLMHPRLRKSQISVFHKMPKDLPLISCVPLQLQQAILNLMINSCDALDTRYPSFDLNKKITISIRQEQNDGKQELVLVIEDLGCGIQSADKVNLRDPFFTTKEYGTGLGLSISESIIKTLEGKIEIESEPNEYTRVSLYLPLTKDEQVA